MASGHKEWSINAVLRETNEAGQTKKTHPKNSVRLIEKHKNKRSTGDYHHLTGARTPAIRLRVFSDSIAIRSDAPSCDYACSHTVHNMLVDCVMRPCVFLAFHRGHLI